MSKPPALPAQLSRPDAQLIIDALNLRIHTLELGGSSKAFEELEARVKKLEEFEG